MTLNICAESEFLRVTATGAFSLAEAKRAFLEVLAAIARHKSEKVLFDGRALTGEPNFMERFYYGEFAAQMAARFREYGVTRAPQFAYVLQKPVLDPRRFGETIAVNRGMHVKTFENLEGALEWLGFPPANKLDASHTEPCA